MCFIGSATKQTIFSRWSIYDKIYMIQWEGYQMKIREIKKKIREIKKNARTNLNKNRKIYFKLGSIQAVINLVSYFIGMPMFIQILEYESLRSQGVNTREPHTFLFTLIFVAYHIITVIIQSLLVAYMTRKNENHNIMTDFTSFGTMWTLTGIQVYLKKLIGASTSLIFFILYGVVSSHGYDADYLIWIGYLIGFIGYFLAPTRSYIASAQSVILSMDAKQSISESKTLLKGHYWEVTAIRLSFLFWDILNIMTCGILSLYLTPYKTAVMLEYRKEILQ